MPALLIVCALLAVQAASTPAAPPGSLVGRVTTGSGPVRYARVLLEHANGDLRAAHSDATGGFRFDQLAPGAYRLSAAKPGFVSPVAAAAPSTSTPARVVVSAGQTATIDLRLEAGIGIEGTLVSAQRARLGRMLTQTLAADRLVPAPGSESRAEAYTLMAEDGGRFRFHSLPAGRYVLRVNAGFVGAPDWYYPGTPNRGDAQVFDFLPGQTFLLGEFALPETMRANVAPVEAASPGANAIEGRVVDEFGDPLPDVEVQLLQRRFLAGRFRLFPRNTPSGSATTTFACATDNLGRFRFDNVPAGEHYLLALSRPFVGSVQPLPKHAGPAGLAPTYFPSTDQASEAKPVHVRAGDVSSGLQIAMRSAATGDLAIVRLDTQGAPIPESDIVSLPADVLFQNQRGEPQPAARAVVLDANDKLPPGRFFSSSAEVNARLRSRGLAELRVLRDLPVGDYFLWRDTETIPLSIAPGTNQVTLRSSPPFPAPPQSRLIAGRVTLAADTRAPTPGDVEIGFEVTDLARILSMGDSGGRTVASLDQSWKFRAAVPYSGSPTVVRVKGPSGWALERVTYQGRDVTDTPTAFETNADVEVVLTNRTGTFAGRVANGGEPSSRYGVILFAEDRQRWTYPSRFIHVAHAGSRGEFTLTGVLPGRYLAAALPTNTDEGADPEWLDMMRPAAMALTIAEGRTTTVDVQIPR